MLPDRSGEHSSYPWHSPASASMEIRRFDAPPPFAGRECQEVPDPEAGEVVRHDGAQEPGASSATPGRRRGRPARAADEIASYPSDAALIEGFRSGAEAGGSKFKTWSDYASVLEKFSAWLRKHGKAGLHERPFDEDFSRDVQRYRAKVGGHVAEHLPAALGHLERWSAQPDAVVRIPSPHRLQVPEEDLWLIQEALPGEDVASGNDRARLKSFSSWLQNAGEPGLCDQDSLRSERLMHNATRFEGKRPTSGTKLSSLLSRLRTFDLTGISPSRKAQLNVRAISDEDHQLSERFTSWLREKGQGGKPDTRGYDNAFKRGTAVRSLSAWLGQVGNNPTPLAFRLDDPTLDVDVDVFTFDKPKSFANAQKRLLKLLREMTAEGGQAAQMPAQTPQSSFGLPDSDWSGWRFDPDMPGGAGEGAAAMLAQTPQSSFVLPDSDWSGWRFDPDMPGSAGVGAAQTPQSSFVLPDSDWSGWRGDPNALPPHAGAWPEEQTLRHATDSPADSQEVSGPSWAAPSTASGVDQHGWELGLHAPHGGADWEPAPRMPSFGPEDTGPQWEHGAQVAPPWLLERGVSDQQIVRIREVAYRVAAMPGMSNAWGGPLLCIYPHLQGG